MHSLSSGEMLKPPRRTPLLNSADELLNPEVHFRPFIFAARSRCSPSPFVRFSPKNNTNRFKPRHLCPWQSVGLKVLIY